jgi:hypothetical protein
MQQDDNTTQSAVDEPLNYRDDTHVMRYLLHNIKGISPVSGGEMEDDLVPEYIPAEPSDEDTVS